MQVTAIETKHLSVEEYRNKISPYLKAIINNFKNDRLYYKCHKIDWIKNNKTKATINPINKKDNK